MMRLLSVLLFALALQSQSAAAGSWPEPSAAYQGTRVIKSGDMEMSGRVFHDHGKERFEMSMEGMSQVMILRPDLKKMFMFLPQMNMAMEMPYKDNGNMPTPDRYSETDAEVVGEEVIAGEQTTKYRVEGNEAGGPYTVFFWITDDGIAMRTEASSAQGSFEMYLDGLQRGAQPAELFELPSGVQIMPANPAMMNPMMPGQG